MSSFSRKIINRIKCVFGCHDFDGCICKNCKYNRQTEHKLKGCKCSICGHIQHNFHKKTLNDQFIEECEYCGLVLLRCPRCNGDGVISCRNCDGSGQVERWTDYLNGNFGGYDPCFSHTPTHSCERCNGTGWIDLKAEQEVCSNCRDGTGASSCGACTSCSVWQQKNS